MASGGAEKDIASLHAGQIESGVLRKMGDEFDADVRERRGRGPTGHEEKGGRRRERVVLANRGLENG